MHVHDARGVGIAVYRALSGSHTYSLVVFAHDLDAGLRSDRVIAEAWIERRGRETCFAAGRLLDAAGTVLATASSTMRLVPCDAVEESALQAFA